MIIDGTGKVLKAIGKRQLSEGQATNIVNPNDPNAGGGGSGGRSRGAPYVKNPPPAKTSVPIP